MAGAPTPVKPDPKELKKAEELWDKFTVFSKWSIVGIAIVLAALGFVFVDW